MTLEEHIAFVADLEERDQLILLDEVSYQPANSTRWLFGLTSGFYFADGHTRQKREAALSLAERYYDMCEGRANRLVDGKRSRTLSCREDIRRLLDNARYFADDQTIGFYLRHFERAAEGLSSAPVHDSCTSFLPGFGIRGANGKVTYQTRLKEIEDGVGDVVSRFVDDCQELNVFYAVSGMSLLFYAYATSASEEAHALFSRFPGLLYEDGTEFYLEINDRTDVIRDVNWLTAINDDLLARVGGVEKARAVLGDEVVLHPYTGGIVFQAGAAPRLGDLSKGKIPAAYCRLNDFLRPLRYETWDQPYLRVPFGVDGMEATNRWTRRFDRD